MVEFAALPGSVFRHTQSCSCVTFSDEHEADTAPSHDKEAVGASLLGGGSNVTG